MWSYFITSSSQMSWNRSVGTAVGCWVNPYQTLLQAAEVLLHLPQEQLQLAARHVELLLGLVGVLGLLLGPELGPQGLEGGLLTPSALQLPLQIL